MRIRINARCAWGCLSLRGPDEATKSAPQHLSCGAPWRKIVYATQACAYRVKAWRKSAPHLYFYRRTVAQPAQKKSGQIAKSVAAQSMRIPLAKLDAVNRAVTRAVFGRK
jgi:hypothetical protein